MLINMNVALKLQANLVAFNFYNLETLAGILEGANEENKVVIASFGESYIDHVPLSVVASLAKAYGKIMKMPFVLHLDHATKIENIIEAIDLGFTSVMYDGSKLSLEENIRQTKVVIEYARQRSISVEGELGYLNKEDGSDEVEIIHTTMEDAKLFTDETLVDTLAIAVGNAHGLYKSKPDINIARIQEISQVTLTPLVLHGSSGISKDVLKEAFTQGIRKINVNTELTLAATAAAYRYINAHENTPRFECVMMVSKEEIKKVCKEFLKI